MIDKPDAFLFGVTRALLAEYDLTTVMGALCAIDLRKAPPAPAPLATPQPGMPPAAWAITEALARRCPPMDIVRALAMIGTAMEAAAKAPPKAAPPVPRAVLRSYSSPNVLILAGQPRRRRRSPAMPAILPPNVTRLHRGT